MPWGVTQPRERGSLYTGCFTSYVADFFHMPPKSHLQSHKGPPTSQVCIALWNFCHFYWEESIIRTGNVQVKWELEMLQVRFELALVAWAPQLNVKCFVHLKLSRSFHQVTNHIYWLIWDRVRQHSRLFGCFPVLEDGVIENRESGNLCAKSYMSPVTTATFTFKERGNTRAVV